MSAVGSSKIIFGDDIDSEQVKEIFREAFKRSQKLYEFGLHSQKRFEIIFKVVFVAGFTHGLGEGFQQKGERIKDIMQEYLKGQGLDK